MQNILSIDTVFGACAVGVIAGDRHVARVEPMQRGQAERLMPMILETVRAGGLILQNLDLIVVNVGPGSFTGVRVGIATARGIALGLSVPVQGVCATDALYETARLAGKIDPAHPVRVTIDSQRGDFFVADYRGADDVPIPSSDVRILADVQSHSVQVMSEDLILLPPDRAEEDGPIYPFVLARLGGRLYAEGPDSLRGRAEPLYLRDADISVSKQHVYTRLIAKPRIIYT